MVHNHARYEPRIIEPYLLISAAGFPYPYGCRHRSAARCARYAGPGAEYGACRSAISRGTIGSVVDAGLQMTIWRYAEIKIQ